MRSCLLLAVSVDGEEITTVEGCTGPDGSLGPVQQAFQDCHGLQCGFCTPGFITTITAYLDENPEPDEAQAREAIAGNLCRCTGYQNIVASVLRAAELRRTELRCRDHAHARRGDRAPRRPRLVTGNGRYLDDFGHDALQVAFVRSPHGHARVKDIDVSNALDVDGLVAIYTYDDLEGPVAEPLPVLIPHPTLTHARTPYCLAKDEVNHVGRRWRWSSPPTGTSRRTPLSSFL